MAGEKSNMADILFVEDDRMIASGIIYALEQEGYRVTHCASVQDAVEALHRRTFQLAILDMQLPDGNGFEISDKINTDQTAVIFLTVVDEEERIVKAFDKGAADYVTKPFRIRELLARVKRTLNERAQSGSKKELCIGDVRIDTLSGTVYVSGKTVELTPLEYRLLLTFSMNKGILLSRGQILESIWDEGGSFVEDNTLTVYMKRLRDKLGDAVSIETVRGIGYRAD